MGEEGRGVINENLGLNKHGGLMIHAPEQLQVPKRACMRHPLVLVALKFATCYVSAHAWQTNKHIAIKPAEAR